MKTIRFALVAVPLLLAGCAHDPTAREIGAATGALLGSRVARNHGRR